MMIVALLPMRHESHRVKQKNYREFNGRPLFHWVLLTLDQCPSITSILIDTDSPVIKEQAPGVSGKVQVIDRPAHLLGDKVPMNDILMHDVGQVKADIYLQTHSTNPLLEAETIERAIKTFMQGREKYDSLFSVTRWQTRFWDKEGKAVNHDPAKLERTQDLPPLFEENSNLYIFTKDVLLKRRNRIGYKPMLFEIPRLEATDIDEEEDFKLAENLQRMMSLKQGGI